MYRTLVLQIVLGVSLQYTVANCLDNVLNVGGPTSRANSE